jgi:hypothetical protein
MVGGSHRRHGRRTPYTKAGIKRLPCFRCGGKPSIHQWQVCADGNTWRPLCRDYDLLLNKMVLMWMGFSEATAKIASYRKRVEAEAGR